MSALAAEFLVPRIKTGADIKQPDVPTALPGHLPLFDATIGNEIRALRVPIRLRVRSEEGLVFVENDTLNLFGSGPSLAAAIEEFRHDLGYFWRYYRELSEDQVAGRGAELKRTYESLFE